MPLAIDGDEGLSARRSAMNDPRCEPSLDTNGTAPSRETECAITPERGDVTTVRAARSVKIQKDKGTEKLQWHAHGSLP